MSSSLNATIAFAFPIPAYPTPEFLAFLGRDSGGHQVYLDEWLEKNGFRPAEQINAGVANGGTPEYMVGVELHQVKDFRHATPFKRVPDKLEVPEKTARAVFGAAKALNVPFKDVGFYLLGEIA